jgi:hypothetical protein
MGANPCADGHAWGEMFVGPEGKDRLTCLKAMQRADWLLWLLVKTRTVDLDTLILELETIAGRKFISDEAQTLLVDLQLCQGSPAKLLAINKEAGKGAYALLQVKHYTAAHECSFISLLALSLAAQQHGHQDKALGLTQAAVNSMVGAVTGRLDFHSELSVKTHRDICARLRAAAKVD